MLEASMKTFFVFLEKQSRKNMFTDLFRVNTILESAMHKGQEIE